MKWAYNMMEQSLPKEIIHPCPYFGMLKLTNMTIVPRQQVIQFPKGYYKSIIKLFDTKDDNIATATLGVELQWKIVHILLMIHVNYFNFRAQTFKLQEVNDRN